mmetsp:Transcript_112738/g.363981  ORF Transcript_112738/g.363981 Transcript_112738/m.363981 type:complete len:215 (+) Transcript_112738:205-849(+)
MDGFDGTLHFAIAVARDHRPDFCTTLFLLFQDYDVLLVLPPIERTEDDGRKGTTQELDNDPGGSLARVDVGRVVQHLCCGDTQSYGRVQCPTKRAAHGDCPGCDASPDGQAEVVLRVLRSGHRQHHKDIHGTKEELSHKGALEAVLCAVGGAVQADVQHIGRKVACLAIGAHSHPREGARTELQRAVGQAVHARKLVAAAEDDSEGDSRVKVCA